MYAKNILLEITDAWSTIGWYTKSGSITLVTL